MRLLITGGLGFIGTEVLKQLAKRKDIQVTVLDNLMHFQSPRIIAKQYPHIIFKLGDIRDQSSIKYLASRFDTVLHLAAIVGTPACKVDTRFAFDVNVRGTHNVITSLSEHQKLVLLSSTSAYGDRAGEVVTENTPLAPLTEYGVHKKANEVSHQLHGKARTLIVRPATAFGGSDHMRLDTLPNTLTYDALLRKEIRVFQPEVTRTFIHVQDLARALIYAVDGHFGWDTSYNIGDPKFTITKGEMALSIAKLCGAKCITQSGQDPDKRNYEIDFSKMLNAGFEPKRTLRYAVNQIKQMMPIDDPDALTTAARVERYLLYTR